MLRFCVTISSKEFYFLLNVIKVTDNGLNGYEISNKFNRFYDREVGFVPEFCCFYHVGYLRCPHCTILRWTWPVILRAFFISTLGIVQRLWGYPNGYRLVDGR